MTVIAYATRRCDHAKYQTEQQRFYLNRTNNGEIYNIATNNSHKVSDVIEYISQITKMSFLQ